MQCRGLQLPERDGCSMNVAYIPVRGGSKSIPLKNIKQINSKPLVYWVIKAADACNRIDVVYVSTDSSLIREVVENMGFPKVQVIGRSSETAIDTASTESAMLEFARQYEFDNIVLIQATSPMLEAKDLERGFLSFDDSATDSVLSVVRQKRFHWGVDEAGYAYPVNYDFNHRPRRQEFDGYLVENGAFYITSRENLLKSGNRLSGRVRAVEMDEKSYYEIDEPEDFEIVGLLMEKRKAQEFTQPSRIKMFLTDCDGCLTDGGMYYSESGDELKKFHARDGMGFRRLKDRGIITGIITGEDRTLNRRRADKLQVDIFRGNVNDKAEIIRELCEVYHVVPEEIAYVGDDINDIEAMRLAGYPCTVKNAIPSVRRLAVYEASVNGGAGAVREIIDYLLDLPINSKEDKNDL